MEKDKDDKHRVRKWYVAKGIDEKKENVERAEMDTEEPKNPTTTTASNQKSRQEEAEGEPFTKRAKTNNSCSSSKDTRSEDRGGVREPDPKKSKTEVDQGAVQKDKRLRVGCINMVRPEWKNKLSHKNVDEILKEYNPIFIVTDDSVSQQIRKTCTKRSTST